MKELEYQKTGCVVFSPPEVGVLGPAQGSQPFVNLPNLALQMKEIYLEVIVTRGPIFLSKMKALESYVKNVSVLTSELTYKIDSQTENKFTKGERGSLVLHMHTTIYKITNKALLYSTGNYIQYIVITYKGKKGKRYMYIYVCVCVCVCMYVYLKLIQHCT